jgi:hypothetical protein
MFPHSKTVLPPLATRSQSHKDPRIRLVRSVISPPPRDINIYQSFPFRHPLSFVSVSLSTTSKGPPGSSEPRCFQKTTQTARQQVVTKRYIARSFCHVLAYCRAEKHRGCFLASISRNITWIFGNETDFVGRAATWHPSPLQRGTFEIITTCMTTMILCVWTAIHLNIPEHGKVRHMVWRKFKWVVLGIVAPESVSHHLLSLTTTFPARQLTRIRPGCSHCLRPVARDKQISTTYGTGFATYFTTRSVASIPMESRESRCRFRFSRTSSREAPQTSVDDTP